MANDHNQDHGARTGNGADEERRHVISVLTENKPGVLARVAGLFSARGFNIESLSVGTTETPAQSRITLVVRGRPAVLEQVRKHLERLIDTVKVLNLAPDERLERGLALLKLRVGPAGRAAVLRLAEIFHARVLDLRPRSMILEVTGAEEKIDRFVELIQDLGNQPESAAERAAERSLDRTAERLAAALGQALDRPVSLPPNQRGRPAEAAVTLVEMARTGRVALKKNPE